MSAGGTTIGSRSMIDVTRLLNSRPRKSPRQSLAEEGTIPRYNPNNLHACFIKAADCLLHSGEDG